jgi:hypothetical protein
MSKELESSKPTRFPKARKLEGPSTIPNQTPANVCTFCGDTALGGKVWRGKYICPTCVQNI